MRQLYIFSDNRQPLFVPYYFLKKVILKRRIKNVKEPEQIYVSLTFDVENYWGREEQNSQRENIKFLEKFQQVRESKTTFFVAAKLLSKLAPSLKKLENQNEIGLHGYRHELWKRAHFVYKKPVKQNEKQALIDNSLREFDRHNLRRPFSFRAPYMWCKDLDLKLLEKNGFKADSSDPAPHGMFSIRKKGKLVRIPVTTSSLPYFEMKKGLVLTKFRLFNPKTLDELHGEEFFEYISQVLKMQIYLNSIPHLVFFAHPWEFYNNDGEKWTPKFAHRGEKNYETLRSKLSLLEKKYCVRYSTVSDLKTVYEESIRSNGGKSIPK